MPTLRQARGPRPVHCWPGLRGFGHIPVQRNPKSRLLFYSETSAHRLTLCLPFKTKSLSLLPWASLQATGRRIDIRIFLQCVPDSTGKGVWAWGSKASPPQEYTLGPALVLEEPDLPGHGGGGCWAGGSSDRALGGAPSPSSFSSGTSRVHAPTLAQQQWVPKYSFKNESLGKELIGCRYLNYFCIKRFSCDRKPRAWRTEAGMAPSPAWVSGGVWVPDGVWVPSPPCLVDLEPALLPLAGGRAGSRLAGKSWG